MRKHDYHSYKRVRQAMALRDKLSEDGLGIYEQQVLIFLGSMMANKNKGRWTIINTCFPTVDEIAKACFAKLTRTNEALDALVANGYMTREGFKKGGRPRIRYTLVEAVWDAAWTPKPKVKAVAGDASTSTPPAVSAADIAAEQAILDGLDIPPAQKDTKPTSAEDKYALTENIVALLRTHFGDHATFQRDDAARIMSKCVRACIDMAGSGEMCLEALKHHLDDEPTRAKVSANARLLGGYIEGAFKSWLNEYTSDHAEDIQSSLDELCSGDTPEYRFEFTRTNLHYLKFTCDWLREHLGTELLDLVENDTTAARAEDVAQVIMVRVSEEYKAARRLALQANEDDDAEEEDEDTDSTTDDAEEEDTDSTTEDAEEDDQYDPRDEFHADEMSVEEENRRDREWENRREMGAQY